MAPIHLRSLTEADLPTIRAWMRDAPEAPAWSDAELMRLSATMPAADLDGRRLRRSWLAEYGSGSLYGFAVASAVRIPNASAECELEFVFVAPVARRQGTGRALLHAVQLWAAELAACEVWLEVRASNMQAIRLYEECGFAATARRLGYYVDPCEDAVLMRCGINDALGNPPV